MEDILKIEMNDWLFNSGIVGLYNILEESENIIEINDQYLDLKISSLDNFEDKFFNYFIKVYEKTLSWYKIVSYKSVIDYHEENSFKNFDEASLKKLNDYIRDVVKKYLKSNSYKSAYKVINSDKDILKMEKELSTVNFKKKDTIDSKLKEIKEVFLKLNEIIEFCNTKDAKKYLASKNVIYSIIKNSWNGVCFLNPQSKESDVYRDYRNYFIEPVKEYLMEDSTKYKYNCFVCDRKIKNLKNHLSFLNATGFDVDKKSSHVWEFTNDIAVCPICKLVYSCVPAGVTYVYDRGIYINNNSTMKNSIETNYILKQDILKNDSMSNKLTYKALIESIENQSRSSFKYELMDIQVVRYEDERYKFNILSKKTLNIIKQSEKNLEKLFNAGFKEINTYFSIYELVLNRLFDSQNLFTLVHKLLVYKLSQSKNCYFNTSHIVKILDINILFLKEVSYMQTTDNDIVKLGNSAGYYLREKYRRKGAVDKLNGIAYRMLNALKTNNVDSFMNTLLNCYLYTKDSVPKIFLDTLRSDEKFKTIGYAFVAGIIEGKKEEEDN